MCYNIRIETLTLRRNKMTLGKLLPFIALFGIITVSVGVYCIGLLLYVLATYAGFDVSPWISDLYPFLSFSK